MSTRTIKIPYKVDNPDSMIRIKEYVSNYNNVLRFTYNRLADNDFNLSTKQLTLLQKSMNNVFIDSHFLNSAQYEAKQLKGKGNVIFGGKHNFIQRCKGKMSRQQFEENRLNPLYSVGEACKQGNRKFQILSENQILFKPCRNEHFILILPKLRKNYRSDLNLLKKLQDQNAAPITYKLTLTHLSIVFEDCFIKPDSMQDKIKDRTFAIDLNPNYIGWSVVDWQDSAQYSIVKSGVVSNKLLNDSQNLLHESSNSTYNLYWNNKRSFENNDTVRYLAEIALHYQCEIFSIEKLDIVTKDNKRGIRYNRLVNNQWNRQIFYQRLKKYCDRFSIKFYEVIANYSSFEGNLVYRETGLPDMCLASIELGRRAYEFHHQYVLQDKLKEKNIIFDTSKKAYDRIMQSLEELHYDLVFRDITSLYNEIKTRDLKYRVQLEDSNLTAVCSKKSIKSKVLLYST